MPDRDPGEPFDLSGGALCLDFANTLSNRLQAPRENLRRYDDLLRFGRQTGSLEAADVEVLEAAAAAHPQRAAATLRRALELREAIYGTFSALAADARPRSSDLEALNAALRQALSHLEVHPQPGAAGDGSRAGSTAGFAWAWGGAGDAIDRPLWPIVRSAADLLTSAEAAAVRECAAETCAWLFVDRSPAGRRKWCDMAVCGNRAKARRHYRRRRARGV
jgi:predicted RNA-binding Zn ribbon-like protein